MNSRIVAVSCTLLLTACASAPARFEVAVIGDQQYSGESEKEFPRLMEDIDRSGAAFVVHVGDFKAGAAPCDDELFQARKAQFDASRHPFILTPGDNDWTDCHRAGAGRHDPLERLDRLRALFHAGDTSLGNRSLRLTRQSADKRFFAYRENTRWSPAGSSSSR